MKKSKSKSLEKRHKFLCFHERIEQISVDFVRNSSKLTKNPDESRSFFSEALKNLYDLNIEPLKNLRRELTQYAFDLTQVLFHKKKIVVPLLREMKHASEVVAGHLLTLIANLARDLKEELYEDFPDIFREIHSVVSRFHHTPDILEQSFTTLSYLIYFVKDTAKNDIENVFKVCEPLLLASSKDYIQQFMAESLAYLVRKVEDLEKLLIFLFSSYAANLNMAPACGHVLAEVLRGVRPAAGGGKLHSISSRLLPLLLNCLTAAAAPEVADMALASLERALERLLQHCGPQHAHHLWALPARRLAAASPIEARRLCRLLAAVVAFRRGAAVTEVCAEELLRALQQTLSCGLEDCALPLLAEVTARAAASFNRFPWLRSFFGDSRISLEVKLDFVQRTAPLASPSVVKVLLCTLLPHCAQIVTEESADRKLLLLRTLAQLAELDQEIDLSSLPRNLTLSNYMASLLTCGESSLEVVLLCLQLAAHIKPLSDRLAPCVAILSRRFLPSSKEAVPEEELRAVVGVVRLACLLAPGVDTGAAVPLPRLLALWCSAHSPESRTLVAEAVELHTNCCRPSHPPEGLAESVERFTEALLSEHHELRLRALRCLSQLAPLSGAGLAVAHVLSAALGVEAIHPVGVFNFRDAVRYTDRLHCTEEQKEEEEEKDGERAARIACRFLIGRLSIQFAEIWAPSVAALASYSGRHRDVFWSELLPQLEASCTLDCDPARRLWLWRTAGKAKAELQEKRQMAANVLRFSRSVFSESKSSQNIKVFVEMLQIFSKMENLSQVDIDSELDELFLSLLCERHEEVQRAALLCLSSYHRRKLRPYSEALGGLLGRNFKQGLLSFKLNDPTSVLPKHRKAVADVLLRVLHSQLLRRGGDRSRAIAVFSFLGEACGEAEVTGLLRLLLGPLLPPAARLAEMREGPEEALQDALRSAAAELQAELEPRRAGVLQSIAKAARALVDNMFPGKLEAHAPLILQLSLTLLAAVDRQRRIEEPMEQEDDNEENEGDEDNDSEENEGDEDNDSEENEEEKNDNEENEEEEEEEEEGNDNEDNEEDNDNEDNARLRPSQLRALRQASQDLLLAFFSAFESYGWTPAELTAVRAVAVEPQLALLASHGLQSPLLSLRLLLLWSERPRFLPLLRPTAPGRPSPLGCVLQLLAHRRVAAPVSDMCLALLRNLTENKDLSEAGLDLLRPHFGALVSHLANKLSRLRQSSRQAARGLEGELRLLSVIAPYIDSPQVASRLLDALLLHLRRHNQQLRSKESRKKVAEDDEGEDEEAEVVLLRAAEGLFHNCAAACDEEINTAVESFLHRLLALFGCCARRATRLQLCRLLKALAADNLTALPAAVPRLAADLNAWDARRLEEPDLAARERAYKTAAAAGTEGEDRCLRLLAAHSAAFDLLTSAERGLRTIAADYLQGLIKHAAARGLHSALFRDLVLDLVWPAVKAALRAAAGDSVRLQEPLRLLAELGASGHPRFLALAALAEAGAEEAEEEGALGLKLGLWDALASFNVGRNMRGLRILARQLRRPELTVPSEILSDVLLRLVWHFLQRPAGAGTDEKATQRLHNLADVASGVLEGVAMRLPWAAYRSLLFKALADLERSARSHNSTKLHVVMIVKVLDAFHFKLEADAKEVDKLVKSEEEVEAEEEEEEEEEEQETGKTKDRAEAMEVSETPSSASAERASLDFVLRHVLPKLEQHLSRKRTMEERHKLAQKTPLVEEKRLEVTIAVAIVKLLKLLPTGLLELKLRKVLFRVIDFLRSPRFRTRSLAGGTLVQMLVALGPAFFHAVLREMTLCLTRGFQRHVLVRTAQHLLQGLEKADQLAVGAFSDGAVQQLLTLCFEDLFGELASEKEVEAIAKKLPEARRTKAFDILQRLARYLTTRQVETFLTRVKEQALQLKRKAELKKVEQLLMKLQAKDGLPSNRGLQPKAMLILSHRLVQDTLPHLRSSEQQQLNQASSDPPVNPWDARPDALLLEAEPRRERPQGLQVTRTNAHLLVDFGLKLLLRVLRAGELDKARQEDLQLIDPFVEIVVGCLDSKYNKIISAALRCLSALLLFPQLPSLHRLQGAMSASVFRLLDERAHFRGGPEARDLMQQLFKVVAALVRDCTLQQGELRLLLDLLHLELQAMHSGSSDSFRTSSAFSLLRALLHRMGHRADEQERLLVRSFESFSRGGHASFDDVITELRTAAVSSEVELIREQARLCFSAHLSARSLSWRELDRHLEWLVLQLRFPLATGRASALMLLAAQARALPDTVASRHAARLAVFFAKVCVELEREPAADADLFRLFQDALRALLRAVWGGGRREDEARRLWTMTTGFVRNQRLSCRLAGLRVAEVFLPEEGEEVLQQAAADLPGLLLETASDTAVKEQEAEGEQEDAQRRIAERCQESTLRLLELARADGPEVFSLTELLLLHRGSSVRQLGASRFAALLSQPNFLRHAFFAAPAEGDRSRLAAVVYRLFDQLKSEEVGTEWCDLIVRALVRVAEVCPVEAAEEAKGRTARLVQPLTVEWLLRRWNREALHEQQRMRRTFVRRCGALKFVAAVVSKVSFSPALLPPVARLIGRERRQAGPKTPESLRTLTEDCFTLLSGHLGEALTAAMAAEERSKRELQATKRQKEAELAVLDAAKFTAKKRQKQSGKRAKTE